MAGVDVLGWVREAAVAIDRVYGPQAQLPAEAKAVEAAVAVLIAESSRLLKGVDSVNGLTVVQPHDLANFSAALRNAGGA